MASRQGSTLSQHKYVSAMEATWNIFVFPVQHLSHSVEMLQVHEFGLQNVVFEEGCEEETLENARRGNSKLEVFFLLNWQDPWARHLLYIEIIGGHTWHNNSRMWRQRWRNHPFTLCRMNSVSPRDQERFHLKLLLQHIPGQESYEDLCTVNGVVLDTFKQACVANGLVNDNQIWHQIMLGLLADICQCYGPFAALGRISWQTVKIIRIEVDPWKEHI